MIKITQEYTSIRITDLYPSDYISSYVHTQLCYIVQIEVAKIEEEKKKLLDTIRAQDEKLNKFKDAIKQLDESKQEITKENQQLIKDLEDSRTIKVQQIYIHTYHSSCTKIILVCTEIQVYNWLTVYPSNHMLVL